MTERIDHIKLPLTTNHDGKTWRLFGAHFQTADGPFVFNFYALSHEHAAIVLGELKETATLAGQIDGIIPG